MGKFKHTVLLGVSIQVFSLLSSYSFGWAEEMPSLPADQSSQPSQSSQTFTCKDHGNDLPYNELQVAAWKRETPNQFLGRAFIRGVLTKVYPSTSTTPHGHAHFQVTLSAPMYPTSTDSTLSAATSTDSRNSQLVESKPATVEIIFNNDFGLLPELKEGMQVVACGDYITSIAPHDPYPASPDGALVHWVHQNPKLERPRKYGETMISNDNAHNAKNQTTNNNDLTVLYIQRGPEEKVFVPLK